MPRLSPPVIPQCDHGMCMKTHHPNNSRKNTSKFNLNQGKRSIGDKDLEIVAGELVHLARSRLPDHVMTGILHGCEEDIRQDAVLLAMKWHIKHRAEHQGREGYEWNAEQAIRAALRYCKLNTIGRNRKEHEARTSLAAKENHSHHVADGSGGGEWSPAEIRQILEKSIQQALKRGLISHANASIAMEVYINGVSVKDLAKHLSRTIGAIRHHLQRVNKAIPRIIQTMRQ